MILFKTLALLRLTTQDLNYNCYLIVSNYQAARSFLLDNIIQFLIVIKLISTFYSCACAFKDYFQLTN